MSNSSLAAILMTPPCPPPSSRASAARSISESCLAYLGCQHHAKLPRKKVCSRSRHVANAGSIESGPLLAITAQSPKRDTEAKNDAASKDEVLLKDLDKHFPFVPTHRQRGLGKPGCRTQAALKVSLGLDPMPRLPQTPAVVHSLIRMDGYTVEKVILESFPGLFITGNLYRPTQVTGKVPAVLCPHGHWANARFYDAAPNEVNRLLASGEENGSSMRLAIISKRDVCS